MADRMKALSCNQFDGHTLASVIPEMEVFLGDIIARASSPKTDLAATQHAARLQA